MHMHSTPPWCGGQCAADTYREDIMDVGVLNKMHLITVISLRHLPYLCTQDGVSPGIPPKPHDVTQSMQYLFT